MIAWREYLVYAYSEQIFSKYKLKVKVIHTSKNTDDFFFSYISLIFLNLNFYDILSLNTHLQEVNNFFPLCSHTINDTLAFPKYFGMFAFRKKWEKVVSCQEAEQEKLSHFLVAFSVYLL